MQNIIFMAPIGDEKFKEKNIWNQERLVCHDFSDLFICPDVSIHTVLSKRPTPNPK
jgi:hypothetical protein